MRPTFAWLFVGLIVSGPASADVYSASNYSDLVADINLADENPGSTINLAAGAYSGAALPYITATMTFNATGGPAILDTAPTGDKGILTVPSADVPSTVVNVSLTVNGLTFENAAISSADGGNGAGIRDQSTEGSLTVIDSTFLNNQDGILTGGDGAQDLAVSISNSLFVNNGAPDGFEHAIYILGQSLDVTDSTFCGTVGGHDIKSRAAITTVTNSTLYDGALDPDASTGCTAGSTSYANDLPNGGQATIDGDQLIQDTFSPNHAIVSYGEEGLAFSSNSFIVSNDTFTSAIAGIGIQDPGCPVPVQLSNTTFSSLLTPVNPSDCVTTAVIQPIDEPNSWWVVIGAILGMGALQFWRTRTAKISPAQFRGAVCDA